MKITKIILSVLLALVMTLSLGGLAFAEGETTEESYNWVAIPTSAEGLQKGDYYLDWAAYAETAADPDAPSDLIVPYLAALNAGEWYIDVDKAVLKGAFTIPAGAMNNPEDNNLEISPEAGAYLLPKALREVDLTWAPVAYTTEGLQDSDYYLDVDPARAREIRLEYGLIYVNPNGGLMRMKTFKTITGYDIDGNTVTETEEWIFPLQNRAFTEEGVARRDALYESIKQYKTVAEPENPGEDANGDGEEDAAKGLASLWEKLVAFFKAVGDFFRRLFRF